ncbi:MAG TPA: DUF2946 family protein [Noviherbaspirillum sp.]|nr:DUF2946 family protein [Noviherbaspirillum sp.]
MDDIVKQAMVKWPNVPHCYGWLALDARGNWRMRDERAQTLKLPGDKITNPALVNFINRNYTHDDHGRWYFQNGPQRVYVNLEATPYIARTDPARAFILHTGGALTTIDSVWMTEAGQLVFQWGEFVALLDDRDMAQCLEKLRVGGQQANDEQLLDWLNQPASASALTLDYAGAVLPVQHIAFDAIASQFGFVPTPQQPDTA